MLTSKLLEKIKLNGFEIVKIGGDYITIRKENEIHLDEGIYAYSDILCCQHDDLKNFVKFLEEYKLLSIQRKEKQLKKIKDEIDFMKKGVK